MENVFTKKDPLLDVINQIVLGEKKLTDAELKKREEIAQAMERENPGMDMGKKMAIATAQAKKVAEEAEQIDEADEREVSDKLKRARDYEKVVNSRHNSRAHTKEIQVGVAKDMLDNAHKAVNKTAVAKFLKTRKGDGKVRTEEVEQIDELSKQKLTKYKKNAEKNIKKNEKGISKALYNTGFPGPTAWPNVTLAKLHIKKIEKRKAGIQKADSRLTKEEAEQIDEISAELATKVQKAHAAKSIRHSLAGNKGKAAGHIARAIHASIYADKRKADPKAPIKISSKELKHKANELGLNTEEVEHIDEADAIYVGSRVAKKGLFGTKYGSAYPVTKTHHRVEWDNGKSSIHHGSELKALKSTEKGYWDNKGGPPKNLKMKEEVELNLEEQLENFWGAYLTCLDEAKDDASQQALLLRAMAKDPSDLMKMKRAIAMGDKALTNPVMRQEILKMLDQMMNLTVTDKALLQKTRSSFMKQKQFKAADTTNTEEYVPEEVEELDELSKGTLGNYIKKAATGMNGMAVHAHMSGSASSAEQRDKHFDKAFKRGKGISKAADKLTKEETEQVDEAGYDFTHYRKMQYAQTRAAQKADDKPPFEGGREVKSSKPAAERVKKIAKGMQKKYTKKD